MREFEPVLHLVDLQRILGVSTSTLRRHLAAARRGESKFPLPFGEHRHRLMWHRAAVENYLSGGSQPGNCPKDES